MECEKALDTIYNEKYYPEGTVVNFEIDKKGDIYIIVDENAATLWKLSNK